MHAIARGDAHPPYPPRRYPDESPTILRDMAHVLVRDSDEVVTLEERRRKRESDATRRHLERKEPAEDPTQARPPVNVT